MKFFLIAYDAIHFRPAETLKGSYPLFEDTSGNASILRNKSEQEIVDWLLFGQSGEELTHFVYNPIKEGEFLGWMTEVKLLSFSCVPTSELTDLEKVPGDIDFVIVPASDPKFTIALQCKRVKVKVQADDADKVNKLKELAGAAKQCKITADIGFSRTYLLVVVSIDATESQAANVISRDATDATWRSVGDALRNSGIPPHVGIIIVSATQMTGKAPDHQGGISFGLFRPAEFREQPSKLTERVARYLRARTT